MPGLFEPDSDKAHRCIFFSASCNVPLIFSSVSLSKLVLVEASKHMCGFPKVDWTNSFLKMPSSTSPFPTPVHGSQTEGVTGSSLIPLPRMFHSGSQRHKCGGPAGVMLG